MTPDEQIAAALADLDAKTAHELAETLLYVRTTRKQWADAEAVVEAHLATVAGVGQHDGFIVRQAAQRTEWEHDRIRSLVVARGRDGRLVDHETGEALESEGEAVARAIWACVPASPSWRVGGLKALGLDPSELRQRTPGRLTVEVTGMPVTPHS